MGSFVLVAAKFEELERRWGGKLKACLDKEKTKTF